MTKTDDQMVKELADVVSYDCGDTWLNGEAPIKQWEKIIKCAHDGGWTVVRRNRVSIPDELLNRAYDWMNEPLVLRGWHDHTAIMLVGDLCKFIRVIHKVEAK